MDILIAERIRKKFVSLRSSMNERVTRHRAAAEATALGYGGIALVARATGVSLNRIRNGITAQTIEKWWQEIGVIRYPTAKELPIAANGGGSNSSRCRLWKIALQELADSTGLVLPSRSARTLSLMRQRVLAHAHLERRPTFVQHRHVGLEKNHSVTTAWFLPASPQSSIWQDCPRQSVWRHHLILF